MSRSRRKFHSLYLWHRYTGIVCALLVLVLAITGLLLQHTERMSLQQRFLSNELLLSWYGIGPNTVTSFDTGNHWLSQAGDFIYLDTAALDGRYAILHGAVETDFGLAMVVGSELTLTNQQGQLIETLSAGRGLPEPALAIAQTDDGTIVRGAEAYWLADRQFTRWHPYNGPQPHWIQPATAPATLIDSVQTHNRQHQISWERLLLDLHSGRLLGEYGIFVMDAAAIGLILLAASGLWIWMQRRDKDRQHTKH